MARRALSQSDYDDLSAAVWRALDGPCFCWLGRPCSRARAYEHTMATLLATQGTDGRATVERWAGWRSAPGGFRLALGEPLEDRHGRD